MGRRQRRKRESRGYIPPTGFSTRRGKQYFVAGLVVGPIIVAMSALGEGSISIAGAVALILGLSALAGIIGMFTDNVGF